MYTVQCMLMYFSTSTADTTFDSFNAELVMVEVRSTLKKSPKVALEAKQYNLVIKFLPKRALQKATLKRCRYHIKELKMYQLVAQELNSFQAARSEG